VPTIDKYRNRGTPSDSKMVNEKGRNPDDPPTSVELKGIHLAKLRHLAQVVCPCGGIGRFGEMALGQVLAADKLRGKGMDPMLERMMIRLPARDRDKERDHLRNLSVGRSREIMLEFGCPR
jgi:hypothetical protein